MNRDEDLDIDWNEGVDLNIVRLLLEIGAGLLIPYSDGNTCLHHAISGGDVYLVKLLYEYGADDTFLNVYIYIYIFNYMNQLFFNSFFLYFILNNIINL